MSSSSTIREPLSKPVHGGLKPQELRLLGFTPEEIVDFSASISPLGPPPYVWDTIARIDLSAYPDPECWALREAISTVLGIDPSHIIAGNGSTELIHLLTRAYLREGQTACILTPTFGEYEAACRLTGARVTRMEAQVVQGFQWDVHHVCQCIREERPRLVFLCNPNNPTGVYTKCEDVQTLTETLEDGYLVLDEAYISFVDGVWNSLRLLEMGNLIVLRSMTKDYALPGLRLGYTVAPIKMCQFLSIYQPSWNVNALSQAVGVAVLSDKEYLDRVQEYVRHGKSYLQQELKAMGLRFLPSAANFLLIEVGDGAGIRARLLQRGICVRDCTSFGLPQYIRIGIRTLPDCQRLIAALGEVVNDEQMAFSTPR
jgi:histidinol-phosphate aminotransferase